MSAGSEPVGVAARRGPLGSATSAAIATADGLLELRHAGIARRLSARERRVELVAAVLFVGAAGAMLVASSDEWSSPVSAVLLTATYALVARVRFQLGPGLVRPTQLVFVPMIFLLPPLAVPGLVAVGSVLSEVPEIVRGRAHAERAVVAVADSWYSVGPALLVGVLSPGEPLEAAVFVYVLALAAQFVVDFVASTLREWLGAGISPLELAPVLAMVYLVDALLAPIGFLAVLASESHSYAYLLAVAPGALLALIGGERRRRIEHQLRQAGQLQRAHRRVGEAVASTLDRDALERVLLTTTVEAVEADCGRLSVRSGGGELVERLVVGRPQPYADALRAAEAASHPVTVGDVSALAIPQGESLLTVARAGRAFSAAERDLLEHLAAQAAVSLENVHLHERMRKTEAELRTILEGVADSVTAEDAEGRLVYVNPAAVRLLGYRNGEDPLSVSMGDLVARMGMTGDRGEPIPLDRLPGRRALAGGQPEPLVVRFRRPGTGERGSAHVKASPVYDELGRVRLAISVIEDVTEIKQAEEAQRFLAESSRLLAGSLDVEQTLPAVARLAVPEIADWCAVHLLVDGNLRTVAIAHADPAKLAAAEALDREYPPDKLAARGAANVVRTGRSELYAEIPDELLAAAARDERHLELIRSLKMVSAMAVPMRARDQVVGAITLVRAESGLRFGAADLALAEDLGLRAGATVDNARLYRTRSAIAHTLQASLLPPGLPDIPGLEVAAVYQAAGEGYDVGGDFYDVFSIAEGQWFVVMGDVCGKGAEAAAVTALARYTLRSAVVRHRSPAGMLRWLNDAMLRQRTGSGRFVTIACARLDLERDGVTATLASGGHPLPRILRATGLVEPLGASGTLLGVVPDVTLEDRVTRLAQGDALILYTDGLTEAGAPRVWSPAQLDTAIAAARRRSAQAIVDHLARAAVNDSGSQLRDDLALLAVRALPRHLP